MNDNLGVADRAREAVGYIRQKTSARPRAGIVLGSGLVGLADAVSSPLSIPYKDIPHFTQTGVSGHAGYLVTGYMEGVPVAVMSGRVHYYEGRAMEEVAFGVRVLHGLGADILIATCASGGISEPLGTGALMAVTDHINLMGANPLRGVRQTEDGRDRFVDMSRAYDPALIEAALSASAVAGVEMVKGVLAAMPGPSYETPAEVKMLKLLGADAVTMSTVPEVIMARYLGMRVLAIALITNTAAGLSEEGPDHAEVLKTAEEAVSSLAGVIRLVAAGLS